MNIYHFKKIRLLPQVPVKSESLTDKIIGEPEKVVHLVRHLPDIILKRVTPDHQDDDGPHQQHVQPDLNHLQSNQNVQDDQNHLQSVQKGVEGNQQNKEFDQHIEPDQKHVQHDDFQPDQNHLQPNQHIERHHQDDSQNFRLKKNRDNVPEGLRLTYNQIVNSQLGVFSTLMSEKKLTSEEIECHIKYRNRKKKNRISISNHREKVMEKLSQTTAKKREMKTDLKKLLEEKQKEKEELCKTNKTLMLVHEQNGIFLPNADTEYISDLTSWTPQNKEQVIEKQNQNGTSALRDVDWSGMMIPERTATLIKMKTKELNRHLKLLQIPKLEKTKIKEKRGTILNRKYAENSRKRRLEIIKVGEEVQILTKHKKLLINNLITFGLSDEEIFALMKNETSNILDSERPFFNEKKDC